MTTATDAVVLRPRDLEEIADAALRMITFSEAMLRAVFTLGAIGAGLAIPTHRTRHRGF